MYEPTSPPLKKPAVKINVLKKVPVKVATLPNLITQTPIVNVKKTKQPSSNQQISLSTLVPSAPVKEKKFKQPIQTTDQKPKVVPKVIAKKRKRNDDNDDNGGFSVTHETVSFGDAQFLAPEEFVKKQRASRPSPDQIIARQKPTSLSQVIGQEKAVTEMKKWLDNFNQKTPHTSRCLLLVGPPGVGKTLCAQLLLRESGFSPIVYSFDQQFHCDTTSKDAFCPFSEKGVSEIIYKTLIRSNNGGDKSGVILDSLCCLSKKAQKLLVEVLSGERMAKLKKVKPSQIWMAPAIITVDACEISSLTKITRVCQVVEMPRIKEEYLTPFFKEICVKENIKLPDELMKNVIEGCGGDVRRLLNTLHFFALDSFEDCLEQDGSKGVIDISTIFYDETNSFNVVKDFLKCLVKSEKESVETMMFTHKTSLAFLLLANYISLASKTDDKNWLERAVSTAELACDNDLIYHEVYEARNVFLLDTCTTSMNWGVGVSTLFPFEDKEKVLQTIDDFPFQRSGLYGSENSYARRGEMMTSFTHIQERETELLEIFQLISQMVKCYGKSKNVTPEDQALLSWIKEKRVSYKDLQNIWKMSQMDFEKEETTLPNPRGNKSLRKYILELEENTPTVMKEVKKSTKKVHF